MSDLYIKLDKEIVDYLWAGRSYLCENKECQCHTECNEADKYIEEVLKRSIDFKEYSIEDMLLFYKFLTGETSKEKLNEFLNQKNEVLL